MVRRGELFKFFFWVIHGRIWKERIRTVCLNSPIPLRLDGLESLCSFPIPFRAFITLSTILLPRMFVDSVLLWSLLKFPPLFFSCFAASTFRPLVTLGEHDCLLGFVSDFSTFPGCRPLVTELDLSVLKFGGVSFENSGIWDAIVDLTIGDVVLLLGFGFWFGFGFTLFVDPFERFDVR